MKHLSTDSTSETARMHEALRFVLGQTVILPGEEFFHAMTRELNMLINADFALVGELVEGDIARVRTLSVHQGGNKIENFEYDLEDTPCEEVVSSQSCCFPNNVAELFPKDKMLEEMGIEGYIGVPLYDTFQSPQGLLVALFREPLSDSEFATSVVELFASRVAGRLERDRTEQRLLKQVRMERLIMSLSSEFAVITSEDLDDCIQRTLSVIAEAAGAHRSNIFLFRAEGGVADRAYAWCREDDPVQGDLFYNLKMEQDYSWFTRKLHARETIFIPSLHSLPEEARPLHDLMKGRNIAAMTAVPMFQEESLTGWLGLDFTGTSTRWQAEYTGLLRIVSEIISGALHRRQQDQAVQNANIRMNLALEGAELGMYDWDMANDRVTHNDRWASMLGYSPSDIGQSFSAWEALVHPDDARPVRAALEQHIRGETPVYETEHRLKSFNGEWIWILDKGKVVERDSDGRPTRMAGTHLNITPRKKAEEAARQMEAQVRHTQKLKSLGVLAGGIAHDFNNLLMAILGNADLALDSLTPISPARESILEIERASRRAADLCNQMLAYSGQGVARIQSLDLGAAVRDMIQMLEISISKKAALDLQFEDDLPRVRADGTQIGQIIMNLITNASESLEDGTGTISIRTGSMFCNTAFLQDDYTDEPVPEGRYVFLEVTDTGSGMDSDTLSRLFDPFFTTKFTGRGLGLSAVIGIVRSHHGTLKVRTVQGQGTTFLILFPAENIEEDVVTPGQVEQAEENWTGHGTILVVDDEPAVREVAAKMLEVLGFDVLTAENGSQGLERFQQHKNRIRCVMLDRTMPDMDGDQVLEQIRKIDSELPVIQISGFTAPEPEPESESQHGVSFIQKPFSLEILRDKLRNLL